MSKRALFSGHPVQNVLRTQPRLTRAYATPTATQASSKPPLDLYGIDGTYASALYTAASKSSALDPTARSLMTLQSHFGRDPKLVSILTTPTLSTKDKEMLVGELIKLMGKDAESKGSVVRNFLETLGENNRMGVLPAVCDSFSKLMAAGRGEIEVTVTSASTLDNKLLQRLEAAVAKSRFVGPGKKLKVTNKVNGDILGGLVVEIGDRTIDFSVANKVSKMNKLLTDAL